MNLLYQAWRSARHRDDLGTWLNRTQKLVIHAGGESRRLPAYAVISKAFLPLPHLEGLHPRRFDQVLCDFQVPYYKQVLEESGPNPAVLVAAGDVWLDFNPLELPVSTADIVGIGMRVSTEVAQHFGTFFVRKAAQTVSSSELPIAFFLQKPSPAEINAQASHYDFFVDTGMWLLSRRVIEMLFSRCGWDEHRQQFATKDGLPSYLDLYTEIGTALGAEVIVPPSLRRHGFARLTTSVVPLTDASFYHLGSSRQLFESLEQLQRSTFKAVREYSIASSSGTLLAHGASAWIDRVLCRHKIHLGGGNLVTGLPTKARIDHLRSEQCLEVAPIGRDSYVVRAYHLDDVSRGSAKTGARLCGHDAAEWLRARELPVTEDDVFRLALFPVLRATEITQEVVDWFFAENPDQETSKRLTEVERLSAEQIPLRVNFARLFAEQRQGQEAALLASFDACIKQADTRVMEQDCSAIAEFCRTGAAKLRRWLMDHEAEMPAVLPQAEHRARLHMLLAELTAGRRKHAHDHAAYKTLQTAIVASNPPAKSSPQLALKEDQIVWSRSPVRLDLAGGWTDTPPYCLEHGGAVLNVAVLLNGQLPIQVFVRSISQPEFRLRSIDLGSAETIRTFQDLVTFRDPRSGFSLPKAALALAGFHSDYSGERHFRSLRNQLKIFGGGLEISLLSAIPKGSGLGTSSILGATLLGALNRACALGWDEVALYNHVLTIEQLLTTGGGWQDQAGALFHSIKLIETQPGMGQIPRVRYLPERLLGPSYANHTLLLYYTGGTRLAKGILKEIVRDMFLGRVDTFRTLASIRANAYYLHQVFQEGNPTALHRAIARSWKLNKRLDPGTTTLEIEAIISRCGTDLTACKLLGAGGGGYMLMCVANTEAAGRIRQKLEKNPPNQRARFIDFEVSSMALEVTVS